MAWSEMTLELMKSANRMKTTKYDGELVTHLDGDDSGWSAASDNICGGRSRSIACQQMQLHITQTSRCCSAACFMKFLLKVLYFFTTGQSI